MLHFIPNFCYILSQNMAYRMKKSSLIRENCIGKRNIIGKNPWQVKVLFGQYAESCLYIFTKYGVWYGYM